MNDINDENLDKVILDVFFLYEHGESIPEILDLYPEHKEELQEIFQIIKLLVEEKKNIPVSKDFLLEIISRIQSKENFRGVKNKSLFSEKEAKGRLSLINIIKNQYTMATKWKVIISLAILLLVVALVGVSQLGKEKLSPKISPKEEKIAKEDSVVTVPELPQATDNVDDLAEAIFSDSSNEISQIAKETEKNLDSFDFNDQAISGFGQIYHEDEL